MTRKDYILIAQTLAAIPQPTIRTLTALALAERLGQHYRNFHRAAFLDACRVDDPEPPEGRRPKALVPVG